MKKKLLTIMLSIFMIIVTSAMNVFADGHDHSGWTNWGDEASEQTSLPSSEGNYYLTHDVNISSTWNVSGTTNLCLNGYVINASGASSKAIYVANGATLNLYDCGTTTHNGYIDTSGLWHLDETNTHALTSGEITLPIVGGIITGGNSGDDGGGITNYGTLTMNGGNIVGCTAIKCGAGVFNKSVFTMNGGSIQGCKTSSTASKEGLGAGVFNSSAATFTLSGGKIEYNIASRFGGAIHNSQTATFIMTNGLIQNNKANKGGGGINGDGNITLTGGNIAYNMAVTADGGGVRLTDSNKSLVIYDAVITNNTANRYGGGVYIANDVTISLGKGTKITDNTVDGKPNNVYLPSGKTITVGSGDNAPSGMNVGVSLGNNIGKFATNCITNDKMYFFSDNENYSVNFNDGTDASGDEYLELIVTTIADILPQGFPVSSDSGWVDKDGKRAYIDNTNLKVDTSEFPLSTVLIQEGDNYYIQPSVDKFVFIIESGVLNRIDKIPLGQTVSYSPYRYTNDPISRPEGYSQDVEFAVNAVYTNDTDVLVYTDGNTEPLVQNIDYTVSQGSTHVKLKGSYVSTLPVGTHTMTIKVDGYIPISQDFIITPQSSPTPTPEQNPIPRYIIPNTGVE